MIEKTPNYLINLVQKCEPTIRTRNNSIPTFNCRTDCFKCFFPSTLIYWFNLDFNIRKQSQFRYLKVRYCHLFGQFREAYTIFSTEKV